jgi:hypothetical protein
VFSDHFRGQLSGPPRGNGSVCGCVGLLSLPGPLDGHLLQFATASEFIFNPLRLASPAAPDLPRIIRIAVFRSDLISAIICLLVATGAPAPACSS